MNAGSVNIGVNLIATGLAVKLGLGDPVFGIGVPTLTTLLAGARSWGFDKLFSCANALGLDPGASHAQNVPEQGAVESALGGRPVVRPTLAIFALNGLGPAAHVLEAAILDGHGPRGIWHKGIGYFERAIRADHAGLGLQLPDALTGLGVVL